MSRWILLILLALVLFLPFALQRRMKREAASHNGSPTGTARLVVVTPHGPDIRREFAIAFADWHRQHYGEAVTLDYRTPGATNDIKRLLDVTYRSLWDATGNLPGNFAPDIQVAWGGGDFFFNELKELRPHTPLQPLKIDAAKLAEVYPQSTLAGVRLYDLPADGAGPLWLGACLSTFGIVYNPSVYQSIGLDPPATWADLADPKLDGGLALADPTHSASVSVAYMMVMQRAMADAESEYLAAHPERAGQPPLTLQKDAQYRAALAKGWKRGMSQLVRIGANARYFLDWSSQVPTDVANGDAAAGFAIDFYALVTAEIAGERRARFVVPPGATAITPDPVAILAGVKGRQLELARHFVEFLLSSEAQRLWILKPGQPGGPRERGLGRPPIRRDVYRDRTGWADAIDPFAQAQGFNQREDFGRLLSFSDLRPVWASAWIDSREALQEAYRAILAGPSAQRDALLEELADIPITLDEVSTLRADRQRIEREKGNIDLWKTQLRMGLARRFSDHYRAVAQKQRGR